MIRATYTAGSILSSSEEAFSLCEKSCFGERKRNAVEYAAVEALFLLSENKLQLYSSNKSLSYESFLTKIKKQDKKITTKIAVYSDLRKRGYIVKTALKFGAEFRVYDKGIRPGMDHARWILYTAKEHDKLDWHDFAAKNRVAHSTKKHLMIALVDEEGDVSYYEISWLKP